jgi:release factor glutamine methyltransferase
MMKSEVKKDEGRRTKDEGRRKEASGKWKVEGELATCHLPPATFELLNRATLALHDTDSPRLTAEVLLAHVLGVSRTQLLSHPEQPIAPEALTEFERLLARAATGEPLAYLTGHREFYGLDFLIDSRVLVPRPETELLIDLALSTFHPITPSPRHPVTLSCTPNILDIGTGSGCLAITLAKHLPSAHLTAVDISPDALALARLNAQRHGVSDRITFLQSDLLSSFVLRPSSSVLRPPSLVSLLTANLPYIASEELRHLPVSKHEPALALDGGPDGLALIRRLLMDAPRVMAPNGRLLLEIGSTQGAAVAALARAAFPTAEAVGVHQDLAGLDRVVEITL